MHRRRWQSLVAAATFTILTTACSDESDEAPGVETSSSTVSTASATTTGATAAGQGGGGAPVESGSGGTGGSGGEAQTCAGLTDCGGTCVDVQTDAQHCGGCDSPCGPAQVCQAGACTCACPMGLTCCGDVCVNLSADVANCGACGNVCAGACQGGVCGCDGPSVSFGASVQPIFDANCFPCHAGGSPSEDLNLESGKSYAELVGVAAKKCNDGRLLVAPGDPTSSYLIQKLTGNNLCGGSQMPKGNAPLVASNIATIAAWICQGAPNN